MASGNSSLCQALLGEVPITSGVTITTFKAKQTAYSAQKPFLSDATIKENIIGYSSFDQVRYDAVVNTTLLQQDVADMPSGHETKIGDGGSMLSGGQRQRVSLARALYLKADLLILDDALSGLDANTESKVLTARIWSRRLNPKTKCNCSSLHSQEAKSCLSGPSHYSPPQRPTCRRGTT